MSIAYANRQPCTPPDGCEPDPRSCCPDRDRPWVLVAAILGSSLAFVEGSVVNLALPDLQKDLGVDAAGVQWVVNVYLIALSALLLVGGAAGDRFGLRRAYLVGLWVFGIASAVCALSGSLTMLLLARTGQGIGAALLVPASLALISFHFPKAERPRAIGIWAGASALTTAAGPVIGGMLVDNWGWTSVFWGIVPLSALTVFIVLWRTPPSPARQGQSLDWVGSLLLLLTLAAAAYLFVSGIGRPAEKGLLVATIAGLAVFVAWERSASAPILPARLFRSRAFNGANLMTVCLYFALSGALYFVPFNLMQVQGYSTLAAGAAFLPLTLLIGLGSSFGGSLIGRISPRIALATGASLTALGFAGLMMPGVESSYVRDWLPGILLIGVGMTLCVAPLTTVVMGEVDDTDAGIASGINNTASRAAGVLAIALLSGIAIGVFGERLEDGLATVEISNEVSSVIVGQAHRLADLRISPDVDHADRLLQIVKTSYVSTFRVLMALCAALAMISAVVALMTVGKRNTAT